MCAFAMCPAQTEGARQRSSGGNAAKTKIEPQQTTLNKLTPLGAVKEDRSRSDPTRNPTSAPGVASAADKREGKAKVSASLGTRPRGGREGAWAQLAVRCLARHVVRGGPWHRATREARSVYSRVPGLRSGTHP